MEIYYFLQGEWEIALLNINPPPISYIHILIIYNRIPSLLPKKNTSCGC